ncbi:MAG: hypothetical protein O2798_01125 [Chloroflexi bacterium]|nr:hypothetical protein [Chloroflexota bacterium]MDA1239423.1 hypothetical protein [Chloroflexota bacterium]
MGITEHCVNCEEVIGSVPVYLDGEPYCCHGCVAGGPCMCTHRTEASRWSNQHEVRETREPVSAAATSAMPTRPGQPVEVALRIAGMIDQHSLLNLATVLNHTPGLTAASLTGFDGTEAWFRVVATSPEALVAALGRVPGYSFNAEVAHGAVAATSVVPLVPDWEPADSSVLPARPRFRVFRRTEPGEPETNVRAQSATATVAPHDTVFATPQERPEPSLLRAHRTTLIVHPIQSFASLNQFQSAVRALPGVVNTSIRRFHSGTLHLTVDHEALIPLASRLSGMNALPFRVVRETDDELEVVLGA